MSHDVNINVTVLTDHFRTEVKHELLYENITQPLSVVPYHPITSFIEQYTIPVISLLGLVSNTLSSIVFLQKPLRNSSCSIFLAARGFSDNGFLSTLLTIWISQTFQLHIGTLNASCKIIIFVSYVCGYISVWLVVFVTFENYIRICKPFIVKRVCTTTIAEIVVALLCLISACFYSFSFWAMSADDCVPLPQHVNTVQALIYTDTVITLALPLCCIIYLMAAIVCSLIKSYHISNRRRTSGTHKATSPLAKVTKMLFAVTVTFFCLNLPSHINRLIIMISSFLDENNDRKGYSIQEEAIQQITLLMSYLSLSLNFIVYVIFGSKFRKVLLKMCPLCATVTLRGSGGQMPAVQLDGGRGNNISRNTPVNRSLTVLLRDKDWSSELVPRHRAYTN